MALKIRLRQQGRTNRATFRLVVADERSPRDGKYIEMLGWYNPHEATAEQNLFVKTDRVQHWLDQGAIMTENLESIIKRAAPELVKRETAKEVERREKARLKRRARAKKKAA